VHVRDNNATFWNFSTGWYGNYVDQTVVDDMVEAGLLKLTNTTTPASAWQYLVPKYKPGQTFAIKVNFNNYSPSGPDPDPDINALIEPVNGLIRTMVHADGLLEIGEHVEGLEKGSIENIILL